VRKLAEVRAFGRNQERQKSFCETMSRKLDIDVRPVHSEAQALDGAHIVNVMTRSDQPVFDGSLLQPGQHINAAGSNALDRREIDLATIKRCDVIAVDSREVAKGECGDLLPAIEQGLLYWENIADLGEVLLGRKPGRTADAQITLFESHGMAMQDVYAGSYVLDAARSRGIGVDLPFGD
jgi:ornithine cyclodeaminase